MAGPWEKYASAPSGPWDRYASAQPDEKNEDSGFWDTASDLAKSAGSGVLRGVTNVLDTPAMVGQLAQGLGTAAYEKVTGNKPNEDFMRGMNAPILPLGIDPRETYARDAVTAAAPGAVDYDPKTTSGEYTQTGTEFATGAAIAGGPRAIVRYGLMPGIASETAGQVTEGTPYEPWARAAAAIGTSLAATPRPKQFTRGADADDLETANRLLRQGIRPTAGQVKNNSNLAAAEGALAPLDDQLDDFTTAAMRTVGSDATRATPKVLRTEQTKITNGMNNILDVDVPLTPDIQARALDLAGDYFESTAGKNMPLTLRKVAEELQDIASGGSNLSKVVPAQTLRVWRTKLGTFTTSKDEAIRDAAHALREVIDDATHNTLRQLGRGDDVAALAKLREQYRNFLTIADASLRGGREGARGILSPERVQTASARIMGRQQVATGRGTPLAKLAEDARGFIGAFPTVNAGGTRSPLTSGAQALGGGGLGAYVGNSIAGTPGMVAGAAAGAMAPKVSEALMRSGLVQSGMMAPGQVGASARNVSPGILPLFFD